jgi:molybdopterin/thiamine biosynthesis adenylyltransferase
MQITNKDLKRYSKQIILKKIGLVGQKKIFSSKVLIVGAGGLGCPLLLYLTNSGVGNIGIVDNDKIQESNLNRQILFTSNDVGKSKVIQARKVIKKINKKIKIKIYNEKINKKNIKKIAGNFDIICDCTDNFKARYLINDYCLKYKKHLISAAISKFDGQIFSFDFKKKTPCFRCFVPETPDLDNNCESDGVMSTLAGIAGTLQANEVINTILNKNKLEGKILVFNSLLTEFRKIKLFKNSKCIEECSKR